MSSAPLRAPSAVGETPAVVSATVMPGVVPVIALLSTVRVGTARLARASAKVASIVPMPAVSVRAVTVTLAVAIVPSAGRADWTAASGVALTFYHVIGAVVFPWKPSWNVPPVGVPVIEIVCTSLTAVAGAPALVYGPSAPETTGIRSPPPADQPWPALVPTG